MQIHHLNCATQCVLGGSLISGQGLPWGRSPLVCHCLLVESNAGLILIDTGLGLDDIRVPEQRLTRQFRFLAQPQLQLQQTAIWQIQQLGFSRHDVQHIILTHLDLDHAGGLSDFPQANVHLLEAEYQTAVTPRSGHALTQWRHRYRYRPAQWAHCPHWVRYSPQGESWFGFECVRQLQGLPPEILLIPLVGHTSGHAGVAVQTQDGWWLHAGDAYYHRDEMKAAHPSCPIGLSVVQSVGAVDNGARCQNQVRLRQLQQQQDDVHIICAHDPIEFERCL